jgi:hypothetical protein
MVGSSIVILERASCRRQEDGAAQLHRECCLARHNEETEPDAVATNTKVRELSPRSLRALIGVNHECQALLRRGRGEGV